MKKKMLMFGLLTAVMMASLTGCGGKQENTSTEKASVSEEAKEDAVNETSASGKDSVIVACGAEADTFFPWHSKMNTSMDEVPILHNIYDSLLKLGPNNELEPLIATEWSISDDGCVYTLKIRDDVYFHNGDKMTMEDVEFSLDGAAATSAGKAQLANYDDAVVVDENTLEIHLTSPYAPFLNALAGRYALVLDKSYYDEVGEDGYNEKPIGTGPYTFAERVSGDHITLTASENYWGEAPSIKTVEYKVLSDVNTQMISLENGDIDVLIRANIASLERLTSDKIEYQSCSASSMALFKFNCAKGPGTDINFRNAVLHAINKEDLNIGVYNGKATVGDIGIVPGFSGRPDEGTYQVIEYDVEKAKEYLAASNYNGEEFKIVCTSGTSEDGAAQIIQGQLMEIGINCTVSAVDAASYSAALNQTGEYGAWLRMTGVSVLDADGLYFQYSEKYLNEGQYNAKTYLAELDEALDAGRAETDTEKRKEIYVEVCDIVVENAFGDCMYYDLNACAYNKSLEGVVPRSLTGLYFFNDWKWN